MNRICFTTKVSLFFLIVCAFSLNAQIVSELQIRRVWADSVVSFRNNFSGARLNDLRKISNNCYLAIIRPEYVPINPSSYYAFEVEVGADIELCINFFIDYAADDLIQRRPSTPWIKDPNCDKIVKVSDENWTFDGVTGKLKYRFKAGKTRLYAHYPFGIDDVDKWVNKLSSSKRLVVDTIGVSQEGRPIKFLSFGNIKPDCSYILVMGGQHPPEATADKGLMYFVDELSSDSPLAKKFRANFGVFVISLINPDGKYHGHWRGTLGGVDSNRDWIIKSQQEIKLITSYLKNKQEKHKVKCVLGIDFHSTYKSLFYISNFDITNNNSVLNKFLSIVSVLDKKFPSPVYPSSNRGTSLDFINLELNASAVTREFGYSDSDEMIEFRSRKEARLLMSFLLDR